MAAIKELIVSVKAYFKVLPFVLKHQIWSFFLLPIILNSLLFFGLVYFAMSMSSEISEKMSMYLMGLDWISSSWFSFALEFGISYLLKLVLFYFLWQFYQLLSLIFLSPLFSYLSEQVQEALTGVKHDFSIDQFGKDVIRGVIIALRNIFYQLVWMLILYVLVIFIPIFAPLLPLALFMLGGYYYGFTMIDYRSEVMRMDTKQSRFFVKKHRYLALGNGMVFQMILFIPVVGTIFAPSFALVAAALGIEELYDDVPQIEA